MQEDWCLSQTFEADGQGFRAACILKSGDSDDDSLRIVVGNQAGGLAEFGYPSRSFQPIAYQHNHSVTALLSSADGSYYITGCKDGMVRVMDASTHTLRQTLKGHEKPVTSLGWANTKDGAAFLITGSWDGMAKVWNVDTGAMVATLPGHENSVCVAGLTPSDTATANQLFIATGSAGIAQNNQISDHQVRLWTVDTVTGQLDCTQKVANDHDGPIRDITFSSELSVLMTCSNDGTVKIRSPQDASCISTLVFAQQVQHPPMMLSVVPLEGASAGGFASSAEDGHVVLWDQLDGAEPTIIGHPGCVWNVIALPNGDIATCCQDGKLRIFTKSTDRAAPQDERDAFTQTVQDSKQKQQSGPSPEEVAKLPLWENSVQNRGTSEGQVQIFNKGGIAIAAQWSTASQTWIEVGQVMGSSDQGAIEGVQYDHVLPIEVDQQGGGVAKLQIGYNNGENPFVAAQRFIDSYMLPQHHHSEIANYIQQRVGTQAPTLGESGAASGGQTMEMNMSLAPPAAPSYKYLPARSYMSFDLPSGNPGKTLDKMKIKIVEFGGLSDSQMETLDSLIATLAVTNRYHSSTVSLQELGVIAHMLEKFEPQHTFPALDLARIAATHADATASKNLDMWRRILTRAFALSKVEGLEGVPAVALPMLTLRLIANAFRGGPGSSKAIGMFLNSAVECATRFVASSNKNIRVAVATALYNLSFYVHSQEPTSSIAVSLVAAIDQGLSTGTYEPEALQRALLALGTVVLANADAKAKAATLGLGQKVQSVAANLGDISREVQAVLK